MDSTIPEVTVMLAATRSMGIGYQNALPWKGQLRKENQYFHRTTTKAKPSTMNAVIMGRKSWDAVRTRPMPGRINVVVTRDVGRVLDDMAMRQISSDLVHVVSSFDEALATLHRTYGPTSSALSESGHIRADGVRLGRIFLTGGGELCSTLMADPRVVRILLTMINTDYTCDAFLSPTFTETRALGWKRAAAVQLDHWIGEAVPRGAQNESGVMYEFMMFERDQYQYEADSPS